MNHSTENSGGSRRKIDWNGNFRGKKKISKIGDTSQGRLLFFEILEKFPFQCSQPEIFFPFANENLRKLKLQFLVEWKTPPILFVISFRIFSRPKLFDSPVSSRFASLIKLERDLEMRLPPRRLKGLTVHETSIFLVFGGLSKHFCFVHICAQTPQEILLSRY